jgi:hypothetical protein
VLQQFSPFEAHDLGHGQDKPVLLGGAHQGQGNAGIAAGGPCDRASGERRPRFSASRIMAAPMRFLALPRGFINSSLDRMVELSPWVWLFKPTRSVPPTARTT